MNTDYTETKGTKQAGGQNFRRLSKLASLVLRISTDKKEAAAGRKKGRRIGTAPFCD
jgi:hypothetical protein